MQSVRRTTLDGGQSRGEFKKCGGIGNDAKAHEYQHTNRREPNHPASSSASHLLSVPDAKDVMKKLSTIPFCLLTKTQPYQRPQ